MTKKKKADTVEIKYIGGRISEVKQESLRSEMHYMLGEKVTPLEMVKTLAGGWSKLKKEAE